MINKIDLKTEEEMAIMLEGGKKLGVIKKALAQKVKPGVSAWEIEEEAIRLISEAGGEASFKKVAGYKWATCVNVNDGVVHGIPKKETIFKEGDVVSIDVGLFYKGFHTDTAISVTLSDDPEKKKFLEIGRRAVNAGIKQAKAGRTIGDISEAIEKEFKSAGLTPVESLTGHGVGRQLHEAPLIPCFVSGSRDEQVKIVEGMTLAIEVMYTGGSGEIKVENDGWTIRTKDAKIAALFEETVALTGRGPIVLTA